MFLRCENRIRIYHSLKNCIVSNSFDTGPIPFRPEAELMFSFYLLVRSLSRLTIQKVATQFSREMDGNLAETVRVLCEVTCLAAPDADSAIS